MALGNFVILLRNYYICGQEKAWYFYKHVILKTNWYMVRIKLCIITSQGSWEQIDYIIRVGHAIINLLQVSNLRNKFIYGQGNKAAIITDKWCYWHVEKSISCVKWCHWLCLDILILKLKRCYWL